MANDTTTRTSTQRIRSWVLGLAVFLFYIWVVAPLILVLTFVIDRNAIVDGTLLAAVHLILWGLAAVILADDFRRMWGQTRVEHVLTTCIYVCICLGAYDALAHIVPNRMLPTLKEVVPALAALGNTLGVLGLSLPILVFYVIQRWRTNASWLE